MSTDEKVDAFAAKAEEIRRVRAAASSSAPQTKARRWNRAARRALGVRTRTSPAVAAFRPPSTKPAKGLDPTPVDRSGARLHGRTRYGQERAYAAQRAARRVGSAWATGREPAARDLTMIANLEETP